MSFEFLPRFLQDVSNATSGGNTTAAMAASSDSVVIRTTLKTYGSIYLALIFIFCCLRNRLPRIYNIRSWAPDLQTRLAKEFYGPLSWLWNVWFVDDDDFREECGMDALSFTRIWRFGLRLSLVGMANSLWLLPVYGTSPIQAENANITDPLTMVTVGFIPPGSPRFIATVIAAYIQFGAMMYLLLKELEWFTENRHKYLTELEPRNYTVYVNHIPSEYRTSAKLLDYFRTCFSHDAVVEAHIALKIPNLEKQYAFREKIVNKLEHAINIEELKGKTPSHRSLLAGSTRKLNSIDTYTDELQQMNEEIKSLIIDIEEKNNPMSFRQDLEAEGGSIRKGLDGRLSSLSFDESYTVDASKFEPTLPELDEDYRAPAYALVAKDGNEYSNNSSRLSAHVLSGVKSATGKVKAATGKVKAVTGNVAAAGLSLVLRNQDGEPREAGFVTFATLKTAQAALQQIHHEVPFTMETAEAPQPDDIFWGNVGKSNKSLQVGKLVSATLTALLCLLWTVPVAFIASMTAVESLKGTIPILAVWSEAWPPLDMVLAQLAPLALILVKALLPFLLGEFSKLEGPVSSSVLETSLFFKLALFQIIQTFFVSTFSGSITSEITNIIANPSSAIDLLASTIPGQSSYFMQILFVQTFLGQGLELVRVVPVAIAYIRSCVGPNLTDKERNTVWLGLKPLAAPGDFGFADVLSNGILYFMVVFVYGTLAPVTNWFMAFCFVIMISGYRNQLMFIYPPTPDSGGQLWIQFFGISQTMVLIAEITIFGYLTLKKATLAVPMMIPLIVITILFNFYIRQRHFLVSQRLPSRTALKKDLQNQERGPLDMSFVHRKYVQQALQSTEPVYPENFSVVREIEQQHIVFMTPPGSEADMNEI